MSPLLLRPLFAPLPPRSARAAVVRALQLVSLVCWWVVVFAGVVPLGMADWHHHHHVLPGYLLLLAHMAVVLLALGALLTAPAWASRHRCLLRGQLLWGAGVLLAGGVLAMSPHRPIVQPNDLWIPGYWALPWFGWMISTVPRRTYLRATAWWLVGIVGCDMVIHLLLHHLTAMDVASVAWVVPPVVVMLVFADILLQAGGVAQAEAARREEAQRRQEQEGMAAQMQREAARILHDHVLHALHAVGLPRGAVAQDLVRQECRQAVAGISQHSPGGPVARLEDLLARDPMLHRVGAELSGSTSPVPAGVAHAMVAAAHEALGNVERHSRASHCWVSVSQTSENWQVVVTDDGVGFDPAGVDPRRLGVRRSLGERMNDLGGRASVTSRPGAGTVVELAWPAVDATGAHLTGLDMDWMRRQLAITALPGIVNGLLVTFLLGPTLARPGWAMATAVVALVLGLAKALRLRRLPPQAIYQALLCAAVLVAWAANLAAFPDGASADLLWMGWGGTAILHLVALQLPLRRGLAVAGGWALAVIVGLLVRFGWQVDLVSQGSVFTSGPMELFIVLGGLIAAQRLARQASAQGELAGQVHRATARLRMRSQLENYWSASVVEDALPLLRRVADTGTVDDQLAARARSLEARLRDELVVGPDQAELLAALADLRRSGWQVTTALHDAHTDEPLDALAGMLRQLGFPDRAGQVLTVTTTAREGVAVALEPSPGQQLRWNESSSLRSRDVAVDADDEFARLRVPLVPVGDAA